MDELTREDCLAFMEGRAGLCQLLSSVYHSEMTDGLMGTLAANPLPNLEGDDDTAGGWRDLLAYLKKRDSDGVRRLRSEYARIMLGAGAVDLRQMASPYESAYTSENRILMQDARDQVVALYYQEHLDVAEDSHEPEDHIGFELEFVSTLFKRAEASYQEGNVAEALRLIEVIKRFYEGHLCGWVPAFCDDVIRLDREGFYRAIARITKGLVADEPAYLDMVIGVLESEREQG